MRAMLSGADGVVSVTANAAPAAVRALCDAALAGDRASARAADDRLIALNSLLGVEPNPIPVKWALQELGLGSATPRLPLLPLSAAHRSRVAQALRDLGLAVQPRHSDAA
jgi:4-hydroxy-tetrahydrodipicolinate synthase